MEKFTQHTGVGVPLRRSNVDTDQIIPAVYLKRVTRDGFEDGLFSAWRNDPAFVLNNDAYTAGSVLVAGPDFGTGSSSLGYLQRFPIDALKIDKSFVDGIATDDSEDPALVRAIVQMASTLSLDTIAEGIEGADQLDELRSAGCRTGQGYLFARPLHAEALEAFLNAADAGAVEALT